jgi:hypothetical protein
MQTCDVPTLSSISWAALASNCNLQVSSKTEFNPSLSARWRELQPQKLTSLSTCHRTRSESYLHIWLYLLTTDGLHYCTTSSMLTITALCEGTTYLKLESRTCLLNSSTFQTKIGGRDLSD